MKAEKVFLYIYFFCLLFGIFFIGANFLIKNLTEIFTAYVTQPLKDPPQLSLTQFKKLPPPEIEAEAVLVVKIFPSKKEKVLIEKNSEKILPIASLTKLMSAIVFFEEKENYGEFVVVSKRAANQLNSMENGKLDSRIGEKIPPQDLLELALIYSSNDAVFALAEVIGVENFVNKMKNKAKEIGMENTQFLNPTGLDEKNVPFSENTLAFFNYSTAKDLLKLTKYILENLPQIFEITKKEKEHPVKNGLSEIILKENEKLIGGKTGYTKNAKSSIIFVFENEKKEIFINILLGTESPEKRIKELQKIIDWLHQ